LHRLRHQELQAVSRWLTGAAALAELIGDFMRATEDRPEGTLLAEFFDWSARQCAAEPLSPGLNAADHGPATKGTSAPLPQRGNA
jgi:hypothetical protein